MAVRTMMKFLFCLVFLASFHTLLVLTEESTESTTTNDDETVAPDAATTNDDEAVAGVGGEESGGYGRMDEHGYEWPTLYEAVDDMLDASLLIYPMANIREAARQPNNNFTHADVLFRLPITARDVNRFITENQQVIFELFGDHTSDVVHQVLTTMFQRQKSVGTTKRHTTATLVQFSDDNSNSELVYAIGVDNQRKRVTVCFRGSVSNQDFIQDIQIMMDRIPNPLHQQGIKGQPKTIRIHRGFHSYLFYETTSGETREDGSLKSKYERIITEVVELMKEHPGYKLFVTGHSLGGALAALFSFEAAAESDENIPKPVTCISIAAPFVGGSHWKKAHQYLEKTGKLQYIRVANYRDYVTIIPFLAINFGLYKHAGMELKLFEDKVKLTYSRGKHWERVWSNSLFFNLNVRALLYHSTTEYDRRLSNVQDQLSGIHLNEIVAQQWN